MAPETRIPWRYTAEYYESCNCAYGCPCNFSGFPTHGHCRAVVAMEIREGQHGDVDLSGAVVASAFAWPKAIHDGGGTVAVFFDESTSELQRDALTRILTGQDAGLPYEILAATIETILGPFVAKVELDWNGTDSRVRVGDRLSSELETFRNPVTGEPTEVHVVLPEGFIFTDARAPNARRISVQVDGLRFSEENTNGFHAVVAHSNQT